MTFDAIAGILALDKFPKDVVLDNIFGNYKEIVFPVAGILSNSVIFLFFTLVLLLIPVIDFLLKFLLKAFPKLLKLLEKIKNFICWNMIIKTIQTGFLTYAIEAIKGVNRYYYSQQGNLADYAISITVLTILIILISLNFTFTLLSSPEKLSESKAKAKYGAIYSGLDVWRFPALFQSTLFYEIRIMYALVISGLVSFGMQS
jgi:hypothetical protein